MSPWATTAELRDDLAAAVERFLRSPDGQAARSAPGAAVLAVVVHDPELELRIDVAAGTVVEGAAGSDADARVEIDAVDVHHLLLDHLGPVEISRLFEERRARVEGAPPALMALLVLVARLQAHYVESLRERGRSALLEIAPPEQGLIWESEEPPPPVFGVRRPWQRPRGTAGVT